MPDNDGLIEGSKAADPEVAKILKRSVIDVPPATQAPVAGGQDWIIWVGQTADAIMPWGRAPKQRDMQLRAFFPQESYLLSALGTICARNAAFSWKLDGGARSVAAMQEMLLNSNRGLGWESLITRITVDLCTQDSGAFVELIRAGDSPNAPVINVAHLDAGRCYQTGNAEEPVIYRDRLDRFHVMKWYQVRQILDMPSPVEIAIGGALWSLQYCAVSRLLKAAQILRSIALYQEEKLSGRNERAIHLVRGVDVKKIEDAMQQARIVADSEGNLRYMRPTMVGSHNPDADVGHDTIELATLPDGFDMDTIMKWYISAMAMAFNVDYQDFAPLPGGGLGTSQQSLILHMKSRGKGPALFMKAITHLMNFGGVLPENVQFSFDEQDIEQEKSNAELAAARAGERASRIASTEIDPPAARRIALDAGDLTQEIYDDLEKRAKEAEEEQKKQAEAQAKLQAMAAAPPQNANPNAPNEADANADTRAGDETQGGATGAGAKARAVPPERLDLEDAVAGHVEETLSKVAKKLRDRIIELKPEPTRSPTKEREGAPRKVLRTVTAYDERGNASQVLEEVVA